MPLSERGHVSHTLIVTQPSLIFTVSRQRNRNAAKGARASAHDHPLAAKVRVPVRAEARTFFT